MSIQNKIKEGLVNFLKYETGVDIIQRYKEMYPQVREEQKNRFKIQLTLDGLCRGSGLGVEIVGFIYGNYIDGIILGELYKLAGHNLCQLFQHPNWNPYMFKK